VITEDVDKVLQRGTISIGANSRSSPIKATLDLGAFRIFNPPPAVLPSLAGQE
jgi:hypothetical protein